MLLSPFGSIEWDTKGLGIYLHVWGIMFGLIGAFYAAILALSDLSLRAPKKEVEEVELAKTEKV